MPVNSGIKYRSRIAKFDKTINNSSRKIEPKRYHYYGSSTLILICFLTSLSQLSFTVQKILGTVNKYTLHGNFT